MLVCLLSCNDGIEDITLQIGEDYVDSNTKVYFIDTLTVKSSTFQFDSLIVSSVNRLLIGSYIDPIFGKTQSKSYMRLDNEVYDIDNEAVYDSIALILKYDKYFYNDTIPLQQFKVFKVLEDIEPDEGNYFNTTNFDFENTPIAQKIFQPKPLKNDSINIEINDDYGLELFNKIKEDEINDNFEFLDEYKGLLIEADEDNTTILGFTKDSFMRLYYSEEEDEETIEKTIEFSIDPLNTFNQTSSDKTNTYFETIENQETILPSSETNDSSFIQSGTGIVTRIDIPHLKSLNDISGDGVVIDAKLKFTIKKYSSTNNLFIRDSLKAYIINHKADVLGNLTIGDGVTSVTGVIENENTEFETDVYTFDVTSFIILKLNETHETFYLAIYPQHFNSSVDRYIFNGHQMEDTLRIKLELTYAIYNE
jgi:hypothetical protein